MANCETMKFRDYIAWAEGLSDRVEEGPMGVSADVKSEVEALMNRARVLRRIDAVGADIEVVMGGVEDAVAGFVKTSDVVRGHGVIHVSEGTLSNGGIDAAHVVAHEFNHLRSGIVGIDLRESDLTYGDVFLLSERFDASIEQFYDSVFLLEGFNELVTMLDVGRDENVAYLKDEVPLAEELEDYAQEVLGKSFVQLYRLGKLKAMYELFVEVTESLKVEDLLAA